MVEWKEEDEPPVYFVTRGLVSPWNPLHVDELITLSATDQGVSPLCAGSLVVRARRFYSPMNK